MLPGRPLLLSSSIAVCAIAAAALLVPAFPKWPLLVSLVLYLALVLVGVMNPRLAMFAPIVCRTQGSLREVALTFDDGPSPLSTPMVLAELSRQQVRATFFLLGAKAQENPELVRAIHAAGHEIGLHGYHHDRLLSLRHPNRIVAELERAQSIIKATTGQAPRLFRPPVGHVSPRTARAARRLGLTLVGWNLGARDGLARTTAADVVRRVTKRLGPGSIVLLHDAAERGQHVPGGVAALQQILGEIARQGLACMTVSEALSSDKRA
jgi:peptidoglycan/xylan/chitin deacetylase (PgdA/CDA1 family)